MNPLIPEYIKDEFTENLEEKCNFCPGKYITQTNCCNIKLCQFHTRKGLEDQLYITCDDCTHSITDIKNNAWYTKYEKVYCINHNNDNLVYDEILDEYFCHDHILKPHKWQPLDK